MRAGHPIALTIKEFALLEFLLSRAPDVVSRSEIIEQVWDTHFDTETNLVEVYVNRLRLHQALRLSVPRGSAQ